MRLILTDRNRNPSMTTSAPPGPGLIGLIPRALQEAGRALEALAGSDDPRVAARAERLAAAFAEVTADLAAWTFPHADGLRAGAIALADALEECGTIDDPSGRLHVRRADRQFCGYPPEPAEQQALDQAARDVVARAIADGVIAAAPARVVWVRLPGYDGIVSVQLAPEFTGSQDGSRIPSSTWTVEELV